MAMWTMHGKRTNATLRGPTPVGPWRARIALAVTLLAAAAALSVAGTARAAMYKWVDEKGVVHYTDKMPPEAVDKASVELNKEGIPIKRTEKALTPEQRRAIEQEAERAKETARGAGRARPARPRARVLVHERGGDRSRAEPLAADHQQRHPVVRGVQRAAQQAQGRRRGEEGRNAGQAGGGGGSTASSKASTPSSRARPSSSPRKSGKTAVITAKYDADKQRWRELVAAKATGGCDPGARRRHGRRPRSQEPQEVEHPPRSTGGAAARPAGAGVRYVTFEARPCTRSKAPNYVSDPDSLR